MSNSMIARKTDDLQPASRMGKIPLSKYAFITEVHRLLPAIRRTFRYYGKQNGDKSRVKYESRGGICPHLMNTALLRN